MRLASLSIYPVKSGAGIALEEAELRPDGLAGDRRWMVVDADGAFVTQRALPMLARLKATPEEGGLRLSLDGESLAVPVPGPDAPHIAVRVWRDDLVLPQAPAAAPWLSRLCGLPLRLVHQPTGTIRPVSAEWGAAGDRVSLADGFPLLVTTTASLEALRAAGGEAMAPVDMGRFRPNLVVEGSMHWAEDGWARLSVGGIELDLVKPCARCVMTTTDQTLGVVAGDEPLKMLRRLRRSGDGRVPGLLFGWNAVPRGQGMLRVGDAVEVLATREPWPVLRKADRTAAPAD
ncbi:MOSC domain-containing protein [Arenibaculum pallidiluteum]|uniref:MOSC domain-containing protein n=1 Tax=Arenibaculum pallidiluteum TaxID=2812559 RepID=UPI001A975DA4|nr:MOSC domain-containing protein [Arenibaculum pallidiluteum]